MSQLDSATGKYIDVPPAEKSPSRADYLNEVCTYEEYYRAIAKDAGISWRDSQYLPAIKQALEEKGNLGGYIPGFGGLHAWDALAIYAKRDIDRAMRLHGDWFSIAGGVCVMKQAAEDAARGVK